MRQVQRLTNRKVLPKTSTRSVLTTGNEAQIGSTLATLETVKRGTTPPPVLTPFAVDPMTVDEVFSQQLAASGGGSPFVWSISAGALPTGITLSSAGLLAGTPTVADDYDFTVRVTDENGRTDTQAASVTVDPAP